MPYRIALVGNPNTGKTTLFNRLSGSRAKTSNFPGTTTAARIAPAALGNGHGGVGPGKGIEADQAGLQLALGFPGLGLREVALHAGHHGLGAHGSGITLATLHDTVLPIADQLDVWAMR